MPSRGTHHMSSCMYIGLMHRLSRPSVKNIFLIHITIVVQKQLQRCCPWSIESNGFSAFGSGLLAGLRLQRISAELVEDLKDLTMSKSWSLPSGCKTLCPVPYSTLVQEVRVAAFKYSQKDLLDEHLNCAEFLAAVVHKSCLQSLSETATPISSLKCSLKLVISDTSLRKKFDHSINKNLSCLHGPTELRTKICRDRPKIFGIGETLFLINESLVSSCE